MKKIISIILLMCLVIACTEKLNAPVSQQDAMDCKLRVNFKDSSTKVASQTDAKEKSIRNVQVFVFRAAASESESALDVCASAGFDTELDISTGEYDGISLQCTAGQRVVYAVINDSQDRTQSAVRTLSDFLAQCHELSSSSSSKLLMIGSADANLLPGDNNLSVSVRRMCASVVLSSVSNDFWAPAYRAEGCFRVDAAYLLNVPGRINFAGTSLASSLDAQYWCNKSSVDASASNLTKDLVGAESGSIVNYSGEYNVKHSFYTYPNDCSESSAEAWTQRATILVVETSIKYPSGWQKSYYPVVVAPSGGILSNKQYKVDLTIHRPGSSDPNQPVQFGDVTPLIQVLDWETGESYNPEI